MSPFAFIVSVPIFLSASLRQTPKRHEMPPNITPQQRLNIGVLNQLLSMSPEIGLSLGLIERGQFERRVAGHESKWLRSSLMLISIPCRNSASIR